MEGRTQTKDNLSMPDIMPTLCQVGSQTLRRMWRGLLREDWRYRGGKPDGHGEGMGTLENAATRYAVTVGLGLMSLGAGLALLGMWFVLSREKTR